MSTQNAVTTGSTHTISYWADLVAALSGTQGINPGDVVEIAAGTYAGPDPTFGFVSKLAGAPGQRITIRPALGARATLNGLQSIPGAAHLLVHGLEIASGPGLSDYGSQDVVYSALDIHHTAGNGAGLWKTATGTILCDCTIHDCGSLSPERWVGHGVYAQNEPGVLKRIRGNVFCNQGMFGYHIHCYGSKDGPVASLIVERNVTYDIPDRHTSNLIGGYGPSEGLMVEGNYSWNVGYEIGYESGFSDDVEVFGNVIENEGIMVTGFKRDIMLENACFPGSSYPRPATPRYQLLPALHDSDRAVLTVMNWPKKASVNVDADCFLKPGDRWAGFDPANIWGPPVIVGTVNADGYTDVPLTSDFGCWIIRRLGAADV